MLEGTPPTISSQHTWAHSSSTNGLITGRALVCSCCVQSEQLREGTGAALCTPSTGKALA